MQRVGAGLTRVAKRTHASVRSQSTASVAAAPEKIEVFVNDKKVLVDPGLTILQVCCNFRLFYLNNIRHVHLLESTFLVFVTMTD